MGDTEATFRGQSLPTGTVTFLFTDIEGSTKLAQQYPDQWESLRERHHAILQSAMDAHNGYVFQIIGDAFCVAFHTASDGLSAAVEAQCHLQIEEWGSTPIKVRMGIHTGEAKPQAAGDYQGYLTMSLVQRLMSAGHGGQILLSNATENLLRGQLPKETSLRDMGEHRFKNIPESVRVFQVMAPGLQSNFPTLRALDVFPNNLPTQLTSFVGREKELADVKKLLQDAHLLTLIGPGGTGKTRLSIRSASESLTQYSDGVWLVELAPILDPLLVPRTTAIAIGLRDEPQRPVIDMLCDYLREKKMLIVLDNCEHLVDACAQMANQILQAASNVRIIASSRESLGIAGEVTYRVPSLGLPDLNHLPAVDSLSQYEAVKLFIDRATAAIPSFVVTKDNAPALAQICYRLDGIPLAIELAAAKIRVLSVEQIAKRLDDRFRLLTGGSRTALERHQTLRATIDWSYNLLPPLEQTLFRRLAIFIGGWTLETAESICSEESAISALRRDAILNHLEQLIKKSLVIRDEAETESRYQMLETMRQYAGEKLAESGESDVLRNKHLEYFLNLAETSSPHLIRAEQLEWLAKLDADYENLRTALEWALSKESAEPSLRLCAALGRYWLLRTFWLEGSRWLKSALSKRSESPTQAEKVVRVKALYEDANLANQVDDLDRLRYSAELSYTLAQEIGDRHDIAVGRCYVGNSLCRFGQIDEGIRLIENSLVEFSQMNDLYWQSFAQCQLNTILFLQSKTEVEDLNQELALAQRAGERLLLVDVLIRLSEHLFRLSRFEEAKRYAEQEDELLNELGSIISQSPMLYGSIALINGNYQEARIYFEEMQQRYRILGEQNVRSNVIASLGTVAEDEGNLDQAQKYYEEALIIAQEVNNKSFILARTMELARIAYLKADSIRFKEFIMKGITLAREMKQPQMFTVLLLWISIPFSKRQDISARLLGVIEVYQQEHERVLSPLRKRQYDRAEAHARQALGDEAFESAFTEGQKISLDDALDLALKAVEEI